MTQPTSSPTSAPSAPGEVTLRELIGHWPFLLYLVGQSTSGLGSALSSVGLVFAVLSISHSASSIGLVLLASRVPAIALTLTGGLIADRSSRKHIAVCADAARTALQTISGLLLLSGYATVLDLAGLQMLTGAASALFTPSASALLAGVAPRGQLRRASSLLGITTAIAQTAGLAISGLIVALAGPGTSLLIDGATYAISSVTLALMPISTVTRPRTRSAIADLREGARIISRHGWLTVYATHETILNVLVLSPFFVLGPVIAKAHLGGAPAWSAIALAYVIGNLAAAQVTYHWAPARPILAALAVSVALTPMLALLGLAAPLWLILPAAFLAGAETTIYNTLTVTALQANLPERILGRAIAITSLGSTVLVPVGMGLAGIAAAALGAPTIMLAGAALVLTATGACVLPRSARALLSLDRD